ncbi:MAG TPA: NrfD/PsrC family molybdoenzyme membrane anchor subunit [Tepidisphaeraceae bacterium]|nr:NrfD/PsrC family molybdoenzyme membrane anchor subunit [Tepidisphaeraceae bacterium]
MDKSSNPPSDDFSWSPNLRHRPDPNRVTRRDPAQMLDSPERSGNVPVSPANRTLTRPREGQSPASPQAPQTEPSYYDISMLKAPLWKWEIAAYFFVGGISGGAYTIARLAERADKEKYRDVTRLGTYLSFASSLACPPLLIHDLGDPRRFHHMLRVFKPASPMSLGTWTLVAHSGAVAAGVIREWLRRPHAAGREKEIRRIESMPGKALLAVHDAAGVPLALLLAGYTGVLLSCTANPLWCKNPWIAPLFMAGGFSNAAGAISLALDCTSKDNDHAHRILENVRTAAGVAEATSLAGYFKHAGPKARALTHGSMRKTMRFSIGALIASEILGRLSFAGKAKRPVRMLSSILGLAGGFALRWAFVYGGHEAAKDPHTARLSSRPSH